MEVIEIKKIGLTDIQLMQIMGQQTFFETFVDGNTEENIRKYLEDEFTQHKLISELTNPNSEFHFAILTTK